MKFYSIAAALIVSAIVFSSCKDTETYAQLLTRENQSVNNFLADQRVIQEIPADTIFEYGPNAPYYRLDEDGQLYMQVIDPGTKSPENKVQDDDQIFFRYVRYGLESYHNGKLPEGAGNSITLMTCWFRFNNFRMQGSYQWGTGIQTPLKYLPVDCKVNLVVKSQQGFVDEQTNVLPYLYTLTYSRGVL